MKTIVIALSLILSVAHAGDRNSAYYAICKPMTIESEQADCMAKIKRFNYFDDRGLEICKSVVFDNDKVSCLKILGDKAYDAYEMDHCTELVFESEKIACLRVSGTPYGQGRSCVPKDEAIAQLYSGIRDMRAGNLQAADQILSNLLARFSNCLR